MAQQPLNIDIPEFLKQPKENTFCMTETQYNNATKFYYDKGFAAGIKEAARAFIILLIAGMLGAGYLSWRLASIPENIDPSLPEIMILED